MFVLYIFVSLCIVASGTSAKICNKGDYYYDGCNNCTCTDRGDGYACTLMFCDNKVFCDLRGTTTKCKVGHTYNDGCNKCRCNDGRSYTCEEKSCINNPVVCYVR